MPGGERRAAPPPEHRAQFCYLVDESGPMSAESSAYSLTSYFSSASLGGTGASGRAQRAAQAAASDTVLSIREECRRLQARDKVRDVQLKKLTAQLARTEEAAKRILVRACPEAQRGRAQQMLDAERQLGAARAEVAQLQRAVAK
jgi:hypothetical protein